MNIAQVAELILGLIGLTVGVLLVTGKVKLVIVRGEEPGLPAQRVDEEPVLQKALVEESAKRKRGRPRKDVKINHLHLPTHMDSAKVASLLPFFKEYQNKSGERIVLHYTTNGIECSAEVPFRVGWDDEMKNKLNMVLGGWA